MRVAVAGGTGMIGRATVAALRAAGHRVLVIARGAAPGDPDTLAWDLGAAPPPREALAGCEAIVNLVGISRERGDNTFERAHLRAVDHLLAVAHDLAVQRFVHVSVVEVPGERGPYPTSKREGERLVTRSRLPYTIVRPALVYGPGDDMTRNLVRFVRLAPIFPVPSGQLGPLDVVDVRDVAEAIVRVLARPDAEGRSYDVVGPERLDLRELVARTARALDLPTFTPSLPAPLMHVAARAMERWLPRPPVTRSQLDMLTRGLFGEGEPAARDLDLHPRPLDEERLAELAALVDDPPVSLRLAPAHRPFLARIAQAVPTLRWFPALATVALLVAPFLVASLWPRMLAVNLGALALALAIVPLPWRELLRPRLRDVVVGLSVAAVMFGGAIGVLALLRVVAPALLASAHAFVDAAVGTPSLGIAIGFVIIVGCEDVIWRGAIALPLCARFGPLAGSLVGGLVFAVAHLTTGPPVLWLAAFLAGTLWNALTVRTRSLVPGIVAHLLWDLAIAGWLLGLT